MPAAKPTPAAIRPAIEAMQATRLAVGALDVVRDGAVRIVASNQVRTLTSSKTEEDE
ncbi:hypothetical protein KBY27_01290 [Ruegeria pomeroyi]|uniref:Uncharacterized protein n=1 Tax=Ruegeria pomeroyi TaxID=89184 RepID=A0A9Q3ZKM4_9RHOB|nr:hypothetical protein [Ruegeria pomeroyi]MCE8536083.1 hypothetical protein [Ruegeria pomeroyi]